MTPYNTFPRPLEGYIFYIGNKSSIEKLLNFEVVEVLLSTITEQIMSTKNNLTLQKKITKQDYKSFMNYPISIEVSLNDGHSS